MLEEYTIQVEKDIIKRFEISLELNNEEKSKVIKRLLNGYISDVFSKISEEHRVPIDKENTHINNKNNHYGMAIQRIPKWANNPNQYNHKIIRAYFQIQNELGYVTYDVLEKRCTNKINHPDIYVKTFKSNFDQMKVDKPKSHGKVFEVINDRVILWDYTKSHLLKHKDSFTS